MKTIRMNAPLAKICSELAQLNDDQLRASLFKKVQFKAVESTQEIKVISTNGYYAVIFNYLCPSTYSSFADNEYAEVRAKFYDQSVGLPIKFENKLKFKASDIKRSPVVELIESRDFEYSPYEMPRNIEALIPTRLKGSDDEKRDYSMQGFTGFNIELLAKLVKILNLKNLTFQYGSKALDAILITSTSSIVGEVSIAFMPAKIK